MSCSESISAVIPFAGNEDTLFESIRSICAQTHKVSELVIVDNSEYGISKGLVSQFKSEHLVIHRTPPKIGAAQARNIGASLTRCNYLAFLDADDIWLPNKIKAQLEKMLELDLEASTSNFFFERSYSSYVLPVSKKGAVEKGTFLRSHNGSGSTLMIKKSTFDLIGGFNPALLRFEDWDFMMKLSKTNFAWAHLNIPLSVVQRIPNSNWSLARKSLELLKESNSSTTKLERIQFRSGLYFETATIDFREKHRIRFISHVSMSIVLWPPQALYILNQNLKKLRGRLTGLKRS